MSVKVMARVWAHSKCTGTELVTVLALADWADDDGWCWPSLSKLAVKARVTISQLCKILIAIEQQGGEVCRERSTGGRNRRTRYRVAVTENSVTDNTVTRNTVTRNSVIQASKTVSHTRDALIRHRTVNKTGAKAPEFFPSRKGGKLTPPDPAQVRAFESFYWAYPKRVGRKPALKAWLNLNPDPALIGTIMAATARYVELKDGVEARFILDPATWINQERWTDETVSGNGHGEGPPKIAKREGGMLTLADGSITPAGTYQRKYGISP